MKKILALDSLLIIRFILEFHIQLDGEGQFYLFYYINFPLRHLIVQLFSVAGQQYLEGMCIRNGRDCNLVKRVSSFIYVCVCVPVCVYTHTHTRVSLVAQTGKNLPAMQEVWVWSPGGEIPWRRKWLPTPVFWPGESFDRGAWWATAHRVAQSQIGLSN